MMDKVNECIYWLKMMTCWKSIIIFKIESLLILKKNLITSLFIINFLKTKIKSVGDEVTGLYNKEIPKVDSNHCFAIISLGSALKKGGNYCL